MKYLVFLRSSASPSHKNFYYRFKIQFAKLGKKITTLPRFVNLILKQKNPVYHDINRGKPDINGPVKDIFRKIVVSGRWLVVSVGVPSAHIYVA